MGVSRAQVAQTAQGVQAVQASLVPECARDVVKEMHAVLGAFLETMEDAR